MVARWHTGSKADTLVFLRQISRNDLAGISDGMAEVEDEEETCDWDVCVLQCRICGHRHTSVVPHEIANEGNQCNNCDAMTADVLECEL